MLTLAPAACALTPTRDALPRGCGWYESSHDLMSGLDVVEHDSPDVLAHLPLADWLAMYLSGGGAGIGQS